MKYKLTLVSINRCAVFMYLPYYETGRAYINAQYLYNLFNIHRGLCSMVWIRKQTSNCGIIPNQRSLS